MDPVTHTLVGASLAATRLGEKSRCATLALVVGANLPDVDVLSYFRGADFALGFRRGWTHGIPALVVLPAVLAGVLWLWERWRARGGSRSSPSRGWIFGLCYLAAATHPSLDWLNTYGMRWWMPFQDAWTYGDSVFIVDPWLWLVLGAGWLVGRRPTPALVLAWAMATSLLLFGAAARAPGYQLGLLALVVGALLAALFWRPRTGAPAARRAALAGLASATLYILSMIGLHSLTENRVRAELERQGLDAAARLMVGPTPANPLAWDIVTRQGDRYRYGDFSWRQGGRLRLAAAQLPAADETPWWRDIETSGQLSGFLRWVRFPWLEIEAEEGGHRLFVMDARYTRRRTLGFGGATLRLPPAAVEDRTR